MDISRILLDILIVLVAAKLAAELAERVGIPAVVGEILAGILVGPSVLHLVGRDDEVLRAIGEIGVILLLLDVGLEMDLGELRKVGRSSLTVATIGVVMPMVLAYPLLRAMGEDGNTALFVAAALTATSVGITARVFGDLRALATSEARIVLGAAVADDVMGLVVLTVVVRLVTEGSVSVISVLGIVFVAVAFLVIGAGVGLGVAPALFRHITRVARSPGTLIALAFVFTLAFSEVADAARLAPIVGAFLAGLALGRTDQAERIRNELAPVGHLFIPVFFMQIGIDTEIEVFGKVSVLRDAGLLLAAAVVGKLIAAIGASRGSGDRVLIGLGMLPRGEVGLIFATIGLQTGVLGSDLYGALLLVVLATTLVTPPLLKARSRRNLAAAAARFESAFPPVDPVPAIVDGEICMPGPVRPEDALTLALRAALMARHSIPSDDLLAWFAQLPSTVDHDWTFEERELFFDLIERAGSRSWRFLEMTGVLDLFLPDLADAIRRRRNLSDLDLSGAYRWRTLERLRVLDVNDPGVEEARRVESPNMLLLSALLSEALDDEPDPARTARAIADHIGLDAADGAFVVELVADRHLFWAAARRSGALTEDHVRRLAGHLETSDRARATYVIAALRDDLHELWERARLRQLHELVQDVLAREPHDVHSRDLLAARRSELARLVGDDEQAVARALGAPPNYLLTMGPSQAAEQLRFVDPFPPRNRVRVRSTVRSEGRFVLEVVARDRIGVLAAVTAALADDDLDVEQADLATWADGAALEVFEVRGSREPDTDALATAISGLIDARRAVPPQPDLAVRFDHRASPWHSVCEIDAPERLGLLADLASVFRAAGVAVRSATITRDGGRAYDTFELTTPDGRKVTAELEVLIRTMLDGGVAVQHRRFRSSTLVPASAGDPPQGTMWMR